jgi:hypothetical protein
MLHVPRERSLARQYSTVESWRKRILFNNTCLSPASTLEYLLNMLPTVFVRRLEIVQLLPQILHLRFEFRRLLAQPFLCFVSRTGDKPISSQKITYGKTRHDASFSFT